MGLCLEDQMEDLEVSSVSSLQVLKWLQDISIEAIGQTEEQVNRVGAEEIQELKGFAQMGPIRHMHRDDAQTGERQRW